MLLAVTVLAFGAGWLHSGLTPENPASNTAIAEASQLLDGAMHTVA